MSAVEGVGTRFVGQPVRRREDRRFLTGSARYVADLSRAGLLHATFVRSTQPHADIVAIDIDAARDAEGVVAVLTAADLPDFTTMPTNWLFPDGIAPRHPALADGRVRYVGEPVAMVVADDPYLAADAVTLVDVEYAPLPHVCDAREAYGAEAVQLHDDVPRNVTFERVLAGGDVDEAEAEADVVVSGTVRNQRLIPSPIEPRGVLAEYDDSRDEISVFTSTQGPHLIKRLLAEATGLPEHRLRVVAPDVGGGFGAKLALYREEVLVTVAAHRLRRPVRWIETRSENVLAMTHGRDHVGDFTVAADADGRLRSFRAEVYANLGAYLSAMGQGVPGTNFALMAGGNYRIENLHLTVRGMATNTTPVDTYRGAGRPEATFLIERAIELVARETGIDPAEVRRRNFLSDFPTPNATGVMVYDSGDYPAALDRMLEIVDIARERERQAAARAQGRHLGVGICTYVEFTGAGVSVMHDMVGFRRGGWESATVRMHPSGKATVLSGASAHGQGHETTFAQVAADHLAMPMEDIDVVESDTAKVQFGNGTYNSRSMPVGSAALQVALTRVVDKARLIAADLLEAAPEDVELADGHFLGGRRAGPAGLLGGGLAQGASGRAA